MKVALGQFAVASEWQENLQTILDLMQQAEERQAALLVLPEGVVARDITNPDIVRTNAQELDGVFMREILAKSAQLNLALSVTFHTKTSSERVHNNHFIIRHGKIVTTYTKLHLYDAFEVQESKQVEAGNRVGDLVEIDGFKFGLMTCYDVRFPELARHLVAQGADALLLPAAWVRGLGKESHWQIMVSARALENTCYVIAVGECGLRNIGSSMVVDPLGVMIACAGEAPTLIMAELSRERLEYARRLLPVLENRRFVTPQLER